MLCYLLIKKIPLQLNKLVIDRCKQNIEFSSQIVDALVQSNLIELDLTEFKLTPNSFLVF